MKSVPRSLARGTCLAILSAILAGCGGSQQPPVPLTITTPTLPNATVGTPYSQPVQASGGVGPDTWSVSAGALPELLSLNLGNAGAVTISGTPGTTALGVTFTIQVTDSSGHTASQAYTISVLTATDSVVLSQASLDFGAQMVAMASSPQTVTVTNTGDPALTIAGIAPAGNNPSDFAPRTTCGSSLASTAECNITVTFTPGQPGPRSAALNINDDALGSPQSIVLNGVGISPGINDTLSSASLSFGTVPIGERATQSITLSNYGTTPLSTSSIAASPNFFQNNGCIPSLAAGASCTINVTFQPTAVGKVDGTLSIVDDAPDSPQSVSLSGVGFAGQCIPNGRGCNPQHPTCCSGRCMVLGLVGVCVPGTNQDIGIADRLRD